MEAVLLVHITTHNVQKCLLKDIIYRFRVPYVVISSNGNQFNVTLIGEFYDSMGYGKNFSAPFTPTFVT